MPGVTVVRHDSHMNAPKPRAAREAAAVTEAALLLAGYELAPFTRDLISKMGRNEMTADQAVQAVITRFCRCR